MIEFGDVRSAVHARDLRALLEVAYRKRRRLLNGMHTDYIKGTLPEYEHEVWIWTLALVDHLLDVTNVPHALVRGFAATWAEWMLAGAQGHMSVKLKARHGTEIRMRWCPDYFSEKYEYGPKGYVKREGPVIRYSRMRDLHGLDIDGHMLKTMKGWRVEWMEADR